MIINTVFCLTCYYIAPPFNFAYQLSISSSSSKQASCHPVVALMQSLPSSHNRYLPSFFSFLSAHLLLIIKTFFSTIVSLEFTWKQMSLITVRTMCKFSQFFFLRLFVFKDVELCTSLFCWDSAEQKNCWSNTQCDNSPLAVAERCSSISVVIESGSGFVSFSSFLFIFLFLFDLLKFLN